MPKWETLPGMPNEILDFGDWFISYNPDCNDILSILIGATGPETALIMRDSAKRFGRRSLILKGDWRKQFEEAAVNGLDACVNLYIANIEHAGATTDPVSDVVH